MYQAASIIESEVINMHTLVYVDREMAVAMAVKLVGLEIHKQKTNTGTGGFNWLIQAYVAHGETTGIVTDIRELLPEEVMYEIYDAINAEYKYSNVESCVRGLEQRGDRQLLPGRPISVSGLLHFPEIKKITSYDPYNPPDIEMRTFNFHGERCFAGEIHGEGFKLPIYFHESAKEQVTFADDNPIEITGIVRWSPPYSPRGASSLNLVIRAAAVWLR